MDWTLIFAALGALGVIATGAIALLKGGGWAGRMLQRVDHISEQLDSYSDSNHKAHTEIRDGLGDLKDRTGRLEGKVDSLCKGPSGGT